MTAPRLLLLHPRPRHFLRGFAVAGQLDATAIRALVERPPRRAGFGGTSRIQRSEQSLSQRYGTANEPPAHLVRDKQVSSGTATTSNETPALPEPYDALAAGSKASQERITQVSQRTAEAAKGQDKLEEAKDDSLPPDKRTVPPGTAASPASESGSGSTENPTSSQEQSSIIHMDPPMSASLSAEQPPHLQTPPYVHYFDTQSIVETLQANGTFTQTQAETLMKAVRVLLADNVALAQEGLVSKDDLEMDRYQFAAASNELRTEVKQRRAAETERLRAERAQLQHEVDILSQRISMETQTMKDDLKGQFDDRKMAVRMERRATDNRIQELGYKITVAMNSEMRNEVETLRFILTRRTVLALCAVVIMSLLALRMATYSRSNEERALAEAKRREIAEEHNHSGSSRGGGGNDFGGNMRNISAEELARMAERGENPALVSLG